MSEDLADILVFAKVIEDWQAGAARAFAAAHPELTLRDCILQLGLCTASELQSAIQRYNALLHSKPSVEEAASMYEAAVQRQAETVQRIETAVTALLAEE